MTTETLKEKSVTDIFHLMDLEEKVDDETENSETSEIKQKKLDLKFNKNIKKYEILDLAVQAAIKAQSSWKQTLVLKRADFLQRVWSILSEKANMLKGLIDEDEFTLILQYFDFYSDLEMFSEELITWESMGVVLLVLSDNTPFYVLGGLAAAALAAGCTLIVMISEKRIWFPLFLAQVYNEAGLPNNLLNIKVYFNCDDFACEKIQKSIFCGSFSDAELFFKNNISRSMNFICPSKTAALVLDVCDLSSAVDKIFSETWGTKATNMPVSTVVVQESIHEKFLDRLKFRIEQKFNENRKTFKPKDKSILDTINEIKMKAIKAGGIVLQYSEGEIDWTPTVIIHYQDPEMDLNLPILKVLICRTAKEGISLLNNFYCHGISIWSEISSQALEIASMLKCKTIWINCHGVVEADVPFQFCDLSGSIVIGGHDGLLEFLSITGDYPLESNKNYEESHSVPAKEKVLEMALSAQAAFNKWSLEKNRNKILKAIANSIKDNKDLAKLHDIINYYSHSGKVINFSKNIVTQEFYCIQTKVSVGVIAIYVKNPISDILSNISLIITPALAFGNAVILVLDEGNTQVESLIKFYNNFLPKNLLSLVVGNSAMEYLASDPNVQVLWLYSEFLSMPFLKEINKHAAKYFKHIWVIPTNVLVSHKLFRKECLRNKAIWMTKIDQFP